ncbi:hypothetical protein SESBI_44952 [Sesbania bispinosa]|nr:hypothetical protein SESBI_44952 [Sesbania bispinosa]
MDFITLILHHGGKLLRNEQNVLEYVGSEVDVWEELDCDLLNRFLIIDLCKLHKYHDIQYCFWLYLECNLEVGLREIRKDCDADIVDLCLDSNTTIGKLKVFVMHPIIPDECVLLRVVAKDPDEEEDVESRAEVVVEEHGERDEESLAKVVAEEPAKEDGEILFEVVVEEGLEEDSVFYVHSDSYESAEDSVYRPLPIVSDDDEEVTPIVAEIRSKKEK